MRTDLNVASARTNQVSAVRVEFSSIVISSQVDQGLLDVTGNLNVLAGNEHLDTSEGTGRDETSAVASLGAPGDFYGFGVTDSGVWLGRGPEAEVFRVDR